MSSSKPVILSAVRTPIGSFQGALSSVSAPQMGSAVIKEAIQKAGIEAKDVDEVIMGVVLAAGQGQAPARQAAIGAGLPPSVPALTINKMCGSGLKAVMLASNLIQSGEAKIVVAGGMESMSQAPYLLKGAREGMRMGHGQCLDSLLCDGLWDVYKDFHMGFAAELAAEKYDLSRENQDQFALESYQRALQAQSQGLFNEEIIPLEAPQKKGPPLQVREDEEPKRAQLERLPKLPPAFKKPNGTVTAGNASKINDGASAVVVASEEVAKALGLSPMAAILGQSTYAREPEWFTIAPPDAIKLVLKKVGLKLEDLELLEINEAFSVVTLLAIRFLDLDPSKVNVHGGAVALGHPVGASGARILTTLLYAMQKRDASLGLASLCIGGGEAVAMIVERS